MFDEDDENEEMPVTEGITVALMQPYLDSGRVLFTDNFYTSPSLEKYMKDRNTFLCVTIKTNRKFYCSELVDVQLKKGMAAFYECTKYFGMIACKYRAIKDKA